ncbi:F0F1 ATP synthase subunit epsilon [Paenibacillus mucilaginosus]|uniref:ATP synthase epsilon chain n=2 Tax=Paenibacillus mucilaginosus TaxID=61624 RepID=H6NT28_9BACL|nr:F0F1 ATP synthase subunit epsilon [Paenibacillus mucilaginosus]AEI38706.1 AtpC [Paenibacillus mucilaginosus KNP414]AFC27041.1 AtpC [Paenibacillus mucilaginosus 3016]MCG7215844.1 F0F1 ATP synthase subunit epsilon [Paenibacillus mucilaginosus]WDM27793.1 F0F1 ATP synthase subunit epsilon [Paenibacillus mucilaginosus]WFA15978.1 F0F1 ATP synthase subunit epsilon [Paenibacillus mucilaginosus]
MSTFLLEIVTPERKVYAEPANMIVVKGVEGELGILPNHIPMVTPLRIAAVTVKKQGAKDEQIAVHGGFMEVRRDKVVILAESAELPGQINLERAQAAKGRAEQRLAAKKDQIDFKRAELALQRAMTRINVGGGQ